MRERFLGKVEKTSGCWLWQAALTTSGYGRFKVGRKTKRAHRVSYTIFKGNIPKGKLVLHTCDRPSCVNPKHLFLGSHQQNSDDKIAKGRHNFVGRPLGPKRSKAWLAAKDKVSWRKFYAKKKATLTKQEFTAWNVR